jgi:hypothetical protein
MNLNESKDFFIHKTSEFIKNSLFQRINFQRKKFMLLKSMLEIEVLAEVNEEYNLKYEQDKDQSPGANAYNFSRVLRICCILSVAFTLYYV